MASNYLRFFFFQGYTNMKLILNIEDNHDGVGNLVSLLQNYKNYKKKF